MEEQSQFTKPASLGGSSRSVLLHLCRLPVFFQSEQSLLQRMELSEHSLVMKCSCCVLAEGTQPLGLLLSPAQILCFLAVQNAPKSL